MAVPKRRLSRSRRDRRRAQHRRTTVAVAGKCARCNEPKLPHHVCGSCGFYKDREVLVIEEDAS